MKKLTLDPLQVDLAERITDSSCKYYERLIKSATTLVDLSINYLRHEAMVSIHQVIQKQKVIADKSKPHMHRHYMEFTPTQALVFITSIVPTSNLTYLEKVKQVIVDYCFDVLKNANIIPNNPAYIQPVFHPGIARSEPEQFINESTTINDYLNEDL